MVQDPPVQSLAGVSCLVTGASGFLGRHIARRLEAGGGEVTTIGRSPVAGFRTVVADLTRGGVELGRGSFRHVYHVAGLAHLEAHGDEETRRFALVNVEGTRALLSALERCGGLPQRLLLVSTVAVYGVDEGTSLDEATERRATEPYGLSKRQAEDVVQEWGERHGVRTAIVRLPMVSGPGARGNVRRMVRAIAAGRYLGVGAGTARRSMVRAADVADVLPAAAEAGGTFHLTDGHHPSFAELEAALAAALGRRPPPRLPLSVARVVALAGEALETVAGRRAPFNRIALAKMTSTLTFSDERARRTLEWSPRRVLDCVQELVGDPPEPAQRAGGAAHRRRDGGGDQADPDANPDQ